LFAVFSSDVLDVLLVFLLEGSGMLQEQNTAEHTMQSAISTHNFFIVALDIFYSFRNAASFNKLFYHVIDSLASSAVRINKNTHCV